MKFKSDKSLPDPFQRVRSVLTRATGAVASIHKAPRPNVHVPSPRISALTPAATTVEVDDTLELAVVTDVLVEPDAIDDDELVDVVVDGVLVVVVAATTLVVVEFNTVEVGVNVVLGPDDVTVLVGDTEFADTMSRRALLSIGP